VLDLLEEKGRIVEATKAKCVVLTEEGERMTIECLRKYFYR
jgi:hypothetical protein